MLAGSNAVFVEDLALMFELADVGLQLSYAFLLLQHDLRDLFVVPNHFLDVLAQVLPRQF